MSQAPVAEAPTQPAKTQERQNRGKASGPKQAKGKGNGAPKPKRKPSPQEEALYKKIDSLNTEYDRLREEKVEVAKVIRVKADAISALERGSHATQGKLGLLGKRIEKAEAEVRSTEQQLEHAKKVREEKFSDVQKTKAKLDIKVTNNAEQNLKLIDEKVKALETRLSTETLTLKEEKEVLAKIGKLKGSKTAVREYEQKLQQVKKGSSTTGLQNKLARKKEAVQTLKQEYDEELEKSKSETTKASADNEIPALEQKQKQLDEQVQKVLADIRQAQADLDEARIAAKAAEKARLDAHYAAKREKYLRVQAEKAAREEERKRQELEIPPLANELADCHELLVYLNGLVGNKVAEEKSTAVSNVAKPAAKARKVEAPADTPKGTFLKGKKNDDDVGDFFLPVEKKPAKPKAAPKAAPKPKDDVIKHSVATLQHFAKLDLAPPLRLADVPKSIEAVEAKRADYQKKSDELHAKRLAEFAEREAKAKAAAEPAPVLSTAPEATTAAPTDTSAQETQAPAVTE